MSIIWPGSVCVGFGYTVLYRCLGRMLFQLFLSAADDSLLTSTHFDSSVGSSKLLVSLYGCLFWFIRFLRLELLAFLFWGKRALQEGCSETIFHKYLVLSGEKKWQTWTKTKSRIEELTIVCEDGRTILTHVMCVQAPLQLPWFCSSKPIQGRLPALLQLRSNNLHSQHFSIRTPNVSCWGTGVEPPDMKSFAENWKPMLNYC